MKTTDLPTRIKDLLAEHKLSFGAASQLSKIDKTCIWKLTKGTICRAPTFHKLITKAFRYPEGSKEYEELFGMWTVAKTGGTASKGVNKFFGRARTENDQMLRQILAEVPTNELPTVALAVTDPEIRALFPALIALHKHR